MKFKCKKPQMIGQADLRRVSSALIRLATAASGNLGSDCYIHAAIGQAILARLGVESTLVAGYSAWRCGRSPGDVIVHGPVPNIPAQTGFAYHVWLEINEENILDFTAYTIRLKAAALDKLDGGKTNVIWCPDFIYLPKSAVISLYDVIQFLPGQSYYERVVKVENLILSTAPDLDPADVEAAWMLYQNPDLKVFGPNYKQIGYQ